MMSKKRRSDTFAEADASVKKDKTAEFNGIEFKAMLRSPTQAIKGLEKFISIAKKLPSSELYDVVEGYIKISMECAEIFKLLEGDKHTEREMMLVFGSLEMILLRTASDLSHFNMVGRAVVKKIVSNYMKLLQGSLNSPNYGFVRQCLRLLSAMVSQGVEAAREIFDHIQTKTLPRLAKGRDKTGKPDVRQAFIQFLLSFLVSGDSVLIGHILEAKELLPTILNTGLKEDRVSTVSLILSTLKTRVILNKAITKTQKVRFFTPAVLANIASLYKWNGITDATTDDDTIAKDSDLAGVSIVRKLAHSFLLDLCCSRKHGIIFYDSSFGTAGRVGNLVLLQFLVGLKQATEDELVAELLVNVLEASPDILGRYFKETSYSYSPRAKSAWQDNVKLVKKIYEAQPEISAIFQTKELIPLPRLLSMIMVISLPPICNKTFFTQGLNLQNTAVQLTTVSMMSFVLKKANKNMEYLLDKSVWCKSDMYAADTMEELVQQYRETLGKILPDMMAIISTWHSLGKKRKSHDDDDKKAKREEGPKLSENKDDPPAAETAEVILLKALILQVICLYQKVVPHLVMQCMFDFSKLLKGIVSEKGIREEVPPVLQYQVLQLSLDLPASKFSWFRIQDAEASESAEAEKSVLYLLLKMFVSSSSHLRSSTRNLVIKVLKDTGVFEYTLTELDLWLDQLIKVEPIHQENVLHFLERVLIKLVCNSHEFTDKVSSFVQEAGNLQANLSGQDGEVVSIPVSHIDDVIDMLDVIMEGGNGEMENFGPSLSEELIIQTFPFSAAVPAALEARNKQPDRGVVCEYLCAVLTDVLHFQRDPLTLCLALLQYDKELVLSKTASSFHQSIINLHHYYSKWLPQQCHEELFKSSHGIVKELSASDSYSSLTKAAYIQGPMFLLEESFRQKLEKSLDCMFLTEFQVNISQILLYIKSTVDNFGTLSKDIGVAVLKTLMKMLHVLVAKLQSFQETTNSDPSAEKSQESSDLFLELNQSPATETNKEQILVSALGSVLKHPCMEHWFLAVELAAVPPHSLKPVAVKHLCAQLTDDILTLLKITAPTLSDLSHLELLRSYMAAIKRAAFKELTERSFHPAKTHSRTFEALLSLHSYMDYVDLKDVVSLLLLLPHDVLICPSSGDAKSELSVYGQAALQILTELKTLSCLEHNSFLTPAHLSGLGTLLLTCSCAELEAFLLQTLSTEPGMAKLIHTEVLLHCLQRPLPDSMAIVGLLLQNCSSHRLCFEVWCLEPTNMAKIDTFLPLIKTYLQVARRMDPARPQDVQQAVLQALKQALLAKLSQRLMGNLDEDSEGVHLGETTASLIKLCVEPSEVWDLFTNLPDSLQNIDSFERWQLVDVITEKLADFTEEKEKWRKSVATAALKYLTALYFQSKDHAAFPSDREQSLLSKLDKLLVSAEDVRPSVWNGFVKNGLRYRYNIPQFLNTLSSLLERIYGNCEVQKDFIPLSMLHMMTTSHSKFLPTMFESSEESKESEAKEALVSLLLVLVKTCPKICTINHFVVLLAAYGATLSTSDQKLLLLLREYEKNQVSLLKFQSLLWGPAAVEHHKTRKGLASSLWKQTSSDDVLALLKTEKMLKTISKFPQHRKIILQDNTELLYSTNSVQGLEDFYDPSFLLPLFSALLKPECVIDCLKFVSSHALGVTVMALSSYDPKVRAAAYHVLSCFYQHLEGARFKEKRQLLYLMDIVKNGVRKQNQRLPFILTTYINKVAQQMLSPEDHMYVVLNRFLLSHQSLDLRKVPEFFKLFYGFDLEHKTEREWILNVLEEGISDTLCYELCNQQGIFQVLLCFGSSTLCNDYAQTQIIKVLCQTGRVTKAAYDLVKSAGILSWILQMVDKKNPNQQIISAFIDLLHVLWFTNLGQKEIKVKEAITCSSTEEKTRASVKCLPLPFINEFLCVALAINKHLRLGVKAAQFSLFVQTLCSVLTHRGTALRANKQADQFTLHPQPLSCTETLSLLLCWASLSHNMDIITEIQALSEKYKLKELIGIGKYKSKVQTKSRVPLSHIQEHNPSEDTETVKQEILLTECKLDLSRIFVHWEPVFHLLDPQSAQPKDKLDQNQLASDAAHLLTKCSLRWLIEDFCDENRTKEFLHWFEKAVIKYKRIVEVLMLDFSLKSDFLRLFHHSFEAQVHSSISAKMETLELFTNIMMHLLEVQNQLPECHGAIISACRSQHDPMRQEAGLCLLSLYIHELWIGASSAEFFMSHVGSVTKAKYKKQNGSKTPSAVRAICNEIINMRK